MRTTKPYKKYLSIAMLIVIVGLLVFACVYPILNQKTWVQDLDYRESVEAIQNPDQGFYRPIHVKATQEGVTFNKNIVTNNTQLYHLRTDISAFSAKINGNSDKELSENVLIGLDDLFTYLGDREKSAIVRLAYDPGFGGAKDKEPSVEMMVKHIEQVCTILNKYPHTITAIEVGMIGPWGEMHSSSIAGDKAINNTLIETYLNHTNNFPILVRTPSRIYQYLDISIKDIEGYKIDANEKAYRLGIYNDGYLGSNNDLCTFSEREKEITWLSYQTNHLPYGGEVTIPDSPLHNIETCLPEMYQIHLSYLNVEWDNRVIDKWKKSTYTSECGDHSLYYGSSAYTYIDNHMGYRYVLNNSKAKYNPNTKKMQWTLNIDNVGFGNLIRQKELTVYVVDYLGQIVQSENVGTYNGQNKITFSFQQKAPSGRYQIFLALHNGTKNNTPTYSIRLANNLWNATLKANLIGKITI